MRKLADTEHNGKEYWEMKEDRDIHKYDDIIHCSRPVSERHPPMSMRERAAQFSPFAALTGHSAAIRETARLTEDRKELDEDEKSLINEKLKFIQRHIHERVPVTLSYFVEDERKQGGEYVTRTDVVKKIDVQEQTVILQDDTVISMEQIQDLDSEWL